MFVKLGANMYIVIISKKKMVFKKVKLTLIAINDIEVYLPVECWHIHKYIIHHLCQYYICIWSIYAIKL